MSVGTPKRPRPLKPMIDRTNAVNSLRKQRLFADVSLRLLSDLVEVWHERSISTKKLDELPAPWKLVRMSKASFSLFWSLRRQGRRIKKVRGPRAHLVWIWTEPRRQIPATVLAQLLAAEIRESFGEHVALITCDGDTASVAAWRSQTRSFENVVPALAGSVNPYTGIAALNQRWGDDPYHLFIVAPAAAPLPQALGRQRCHRIVYLTDQIPDRVPGGLENRLIGKVRVRTRQPHGGRTTYAEGADPYFSSFIATVVPTKRARRAFAPSFETKPIDNEFHPTPRTPGWRIARDHCRLPIDLDELHNAWRRWSEGPQAASFPVSFWGSSPDRKHIARWARAITNRQVGLALSGGGAVCFRIVPLIRELDGRVPIDVISGVSGGALLGAFYCKDGLDGMNTLAANGPALTVLILRAILRTQCVEQFVDRHLNGARVGDVDVRFVALTTALGNPPQGHTVVSGTLGEAVRVSGAAPLGFAPTHKGRIRFTDGASGTPIPAKILKDFGADFVVACNGMRGPRSGNPLRELPLVGALHALPIVSRIIDFWVYAAFQLQQISRETGEDAHMYIEPTDTETPFRESIEFWNAQDIIARAEEELRRDHSVQRLVKRWVKFMAAPAPRAPKVVREDDVDR